MSYKFYIYIYIYTLHTHTNTHTIYSYKHKINICKLTWLLLILRDKSISRLQGEKGASTHVSLTLAHMLNI